MMLRKMGWLGLCGVVMMSLAMGGCADDGGSAPGVESADVVAVKEIKATQQAEHARLGMVSGIDVVEAKDEATVRLYTLTGGDPAMNGAMIWLGLFGEHFEGGMYDLGINISGITKAEAIAPGKLHLVGTQDTMGPDGDIKPGQPFEATVTYTMKDGAPSDTLKVETGGRATDVKRSVDPAEDFMGSVWSVKHADNGEVIAQVHEGGHPDAASNGVNAFLTLLVFPEAKTYDLGLNMAGVTKVAFTGKTTLRIDTVEDTMGPDGNIKPGNPVAYAIDFTIGNQGSRSTVIKRTKLPR